MEGEGGNTSLPLTRGAYWPIFSKANRQVAMVKPWIIQPEPTEQDMAACHVPCLMSHALLLPLCVKAGCRFNNTPCHTQKEDQERLLAPDRGVYPEEYEIEDIVDHKNLHGTTWYLIKWKDWESQHNTWEPRENLEHSLKILEAYEKRMGEINRMKRKYGENYLTVTERKRKIVQIIREASSHGDVATLLKMSGKKLTDFHCTKSELKAMTNELLNSVNEMERAKVKTPCMIKISEYLLSDMSYKNLVMFARMRLDVLSELKEWEMDINSMLGLSASVKLENHVDLEGPPSNFTYIIDYTACEGVVIPEDPPIGCECNSLCYDNRKFCCPGMSSSQFAYNRNGTLTIPRGTPIYECNKRCSCGKDCPNRVVQKGRSIPLAIFRTHNGRGWGVKTLEKIKKGAFVLEYIGEVITSEEAEQRGKAYDEEGSTYLFDLDFDGHNEYTVDAGRLGNVAHFINHSCEPNLVVYAVWINNLDPKLPRIAFFSNQEIKKGEELTFDYRMSANTTEPTSPGHKMNTSSRLGASGLKYDDSSPIPNKIMKTECDGSLSESPATGNYFGKQIRCKCGAKRCRKYLF